MKIVFFGTPEFAVPSLESLHNDPNIEVLAVITQPDKESGRNKQIKESDIKKVANELKLKVLQPSGPRELRDCLENIEADFFIVIAYGNIIRKKVLDMPKYGTINVHGSLLPNYRGASPMQQSLLNDDDSTGISIMKMDEEMDHGPVYLLERLNLDASSTYPKLSKALSILSAEILPSTLFDIMNGYLTSIEQNHEKASYCQKIDKQDGEINSELLAKEIMNKFRAYYTWPGIHMFVKGKNIKIRDIEISDTKVEKGKFKIEEKRLYFGVKDKSIEIKKLQLEGKKEMETKEFLNGYASLFLDTKAK